MFELCFLHNSVVNELNAIEDAIRLYKKMKADYPYISDIRLALVQIYSQSEEYEKNNFPFSEAVRYGDILYLSGQVGSISDDMNVLVEGGIGPETKQTRTNIKATLEKYGATMDDVIKCTCMLADIEDWGLMSEEYIKFFPNHKPARSTFAGSGLALGARVEIECMAKIQ